MPPQDVVDVDAGDRQQVDVRDVAGGGAHAGIDFGAVDDERVREAELLELAAQRLGLGFLQIQRVDDDDAVVFCFGGQRMLERQRAHLLRQADFMAAWMRAEGTATASEQIDARRAMAGRTGALLAIHLLAGAMDVGTVFDGVRAGLPLGQLPNDAAMNNVSARLEPENGVGHGNRAGLLAVEGSDFQLHITPPCLRQPPALPQRQAQRPQSRQA